MPGAISPATGLVKNANSTWLNGQPFAEDLQRVLARPVRFANDANCLALSEATDGAAAGAEVVFGVILGTGVGGGLVVHGNVVIGANAVGGEWGHNMLPWPERRRVPGPGLLLRPVGMHRDVAVGPGVRAGLPPAYRPGADGGAGAGRGHRRRSGGRGGLAALRASAGARPGEPDQHRRSRRDRRRRRRVQRARGSTSACRHCGRSGCSPTAWTRGSCRRRSATPAAFAARRGCGGPHRRVKSSAVVLQEVSDVG